jgi:hypothetical protein
MENQTNKFWEEKDNQNKRSFEEKIDNLGHNKEEQKSGGFERKGEESHQHERVREHKKEEPKEEKPEPKEEIAPSGNMNIKTASETARKKMEETLSKKAYSVASISKEGDVWNARVEMIDEEYLPGQNLASMNDIIGVYDVKLDSKGELISYDKKSSRQRGNTN